MRRSTASSIGSEVNVTKLRNVAVVGFAQAPIVAADGRALTRALRVAGRVDPVFVDDIVAPSAASLISRSTAPSSMVSAIVLVPCALM